MCICICNIRWCDIRWCIWLSPWTVHPFASQTVPICICNIRWCDIRICICNIRWCDMWHTMMYMAVPMNGPPPCKPNSPQQPILALSPLSLHHFETWNLLWKADFSLHVYKESMVWNGTGLFDKFACKGSNNFIKTHPGHRINPFQLNPVSHSHSSQNESSLSLAFKPERKLSYI
jgi:hypothetical protein